MAVTGASVGLVQGNDGNFYGATLGRHQREHGSIFRLTPGGAFTNLVALTLSTGEHPYAPLIQGADGTLYGTTESGGDPLDGDSMHSLSGEAGCTFNLLFSLEPRMAVPWPR